MPDTLSNTPILSSFNLSATRARSCEQLLAQDLRWAMFVMAFPDPRDTEGTLEATQLQQMLTAAVQIETAPDRTLEVGFPLVYTTDVTLAEKYGMESEDEFLGTSTTITE